MALLVAHERPHGRLRIEPGAEADRPRALREALGELVADPLVDEDARPGDAALALVEEHGAVRALERGVHVGVVEDEARRLAAELQRDALQVGLRRLDDLLAGRVLAGEGDLVDVGVAGERGAGTFAEARDHVDHARREADLGDDLGETKRRERRLLRGLQDDRAAGRERGAELVAAHEQREVPRDDRADHSDGLAPHVGVEVAEGGSSDLAFDLRGPARVVAKEIRGERDVDDVRLGDRLAVVERLELGELVVELADARTEAPEQVGALGRRQVAPGREGIPSRATAASTSAGPADGDRGQYRPSAGFRTSNRSPLAASTSSPPISSP